MTFGSLYPAILRAEGKDGLEFGLKDFPFYERDRHGRLSARLKEDSRQRDWREDAEAHADAIAERFRKAGLEPVRKGIPRGVRFLIRTPGPEALLEAKKAWFSDEYGIFMMEIARTDLEAFSKDLGAVSRLRELMDAHGGEMICFRSESIIGQGTISRYVRTMEPDRTYYFVPLSFRVSEIK